MFGILVWLLWVLVLAPPNGANPKPKFNFSKELYPANLNFTCLRSHRNSYGLPDGINIAVELMGVRVGVSMLSLQGWAFYADLMRLIKSNFL